MTRSATRATAPAASAVIVEALTDNRNRTASEVRSYFTKSGGNLAETGAVSFMFDRLGAIEFDAAKVNADDLREAAIEAGADDVNSSEETHEVVCAVESLAEVQKALEAKFGERARRASCGGRRTPSPWMTRPARS